MARFSPTKSENVIVNGHFGEFIQGRLGVTDPLVLVTVPSRFFKVQVTYTEGAFEVVQNGTSFYDRSVVSELAKLAKARLSGRLKICLSMPEACGLGSSTATRVGILRAIRPDISVNSIVSICLKHERASDPIMYKSPERLLWAPREGKIVEKLPRLPKISCIGGLFGSPLKTNPSDNNFPIISDLVDKWKRTEMTDKNFAEICAESSERTISIRKLSDDPTRKITKEIGALGFSIAHTGNVRNFIFPYRSIPSNAEKILSSYGFRNVHRFSLGFNS